ncbi:hypothetical protein [Pseudonocardia sp. TRM90224]|uniref:hypothetical protein n=1 Tax=Pseudonocardia sp. TRM90224 TaxID=2812678 RepID=UPI001E4746A8|nr:hypothetical protein [Pseudonocardia sp. TRM90224]
MDLRELTDRVEAISQRYAAGFGFDRTADWHVMKLHEEVGELTQAHLMRTAQARAKGMGQAELDALFAAELADVLCHTLLIARHHDVDLRAEVERKWLSYELGSADDGPDDKIR